MAKFSITQQIEEIDREIELRSRVYPNQVRSGAMRQSVADYHLERIKAVGASLEWLRANETDVRSFVVAKVEARKKDLVPSQPRAANVT